MTHKQSWLRAFCPRQNIRNDHCESERLRLKLSRSAEFLRSRSRYSGLLSIFASLFLESSAGNKDEAWGKIDDQFDLEFCCLQHLQVFKEVVVRGQPKICRETCHLTTRYIHWDKIQTPKQVFKNLKSQTPKFSEIKISERRKSRKFLNEGIPENQLFLLDNLRASEIMMVLGF